MDSQSPMSVPSPLLWFIVPTGRKTFWLNNWVRLNMEDIRGMQVYDVRSLLIKNHMHSAFASIHPSQLLLWKFNINISLDDEENLQKELNSIHLDSSKPVEANDKVTVLELYDIISPEMFHNIRKDCFHGIIQVIPRDGLPKSNSTLGSMAQSRNLIGKLSLEITSQLIYNLRRHEQCCALL
jgi:hypothetical protein